MSMNSSTIPSNVLSDATPASTGTATAGVLGAASRADHVHAVGAGSLQAGTGTTAAGGSLAVTFGTAFAAAPKVFCTAHTDGWVVVAESISTTGFTAKARRTTTETISGSTAAGSAHAHGLVVKNYTSGSPAGISYNWSGGATDYTHLGSYNQTEDKTITGETESAHTHAVGTLSSSSVAGAVEFDWVAVP